MTKTEIDFQTAFDEYTAAIEEKRGLEEQLRLVKKIVEEHEGTILAYLADSETQSVNRKGWTVYRKREVSIKSATGDTADVVEKMRKARLGDLIGLNWPRLKSWVKERMYDERTDTWEVDMSKLPPSIRDVVEIDEFYKLGCKKSA